MAMVEGVEPDEEQRQHAAPTRWQRMHHQLHRNRALRLTTKILVTVVGSVVILAGIVLSGPGIPGPGVVVILAGLAILATEFEWADRWLKTLKRKALAARDRAAQMDPAVRRRRLLITLAVTTVLVAAVVAYLLWRDWPGWSISLWDRAQGIAGFLPELPGM